MCWHYDRIVIHSPAANREAAKVIADLFGFDFHAVVLLPDGSGLLSLSPYLSLSLSLLSVGVKISLMRFWNVRVCSLSGRYCFCGGVGPRFNSVKNRR